MAYGKLAKKLKRGISSTIPNDNNKLKLKGVDYKAGNNRFRARITWNKKQYQLGYYKTADEAYSEFLRARDWIITNPSLDFENEFE